MEDQNESITFLKQFKPGEIPSDASYVTEEEIERLPDYVLELIIGVEKGEVPTTTKEELQEAISNYFKTTSVTPENQTVETAVKENVESTGNNSDSAGEIHSLKQ